jgi:hypothetical protein
VRDLSKQRSADRAQPGDAHFQRWCHERARPLLAPRRERDDVV